MKLFTEDLLDGGSTIGFLKDSIGKQLASCTECIPAYHRLQQSIVTNLSQDENWDQTTVYELADAWTTWDASRVDDGLKKATEITKDIDPRFFKLSMLPSECMYAMYDFLCSPLYLLQHKPHGQQFLKVFTKIHSGPKKLKVRHFVPAAITFLYSHDNPALQNWAQYVVRTCSEQLTPNLFDSDLKPPFMKAYQSALETPVHLGAFWSATANLVRHLPRETATHTIQSIQPNILIYALDYIGGRMPQLPVPKEYFFQNALAAVCAYLSSMEKTVWDLTVANGPSLLLSHIKGSDWFLKFKDSADATTALFWILPFVRSLAPTDLPAAMNTLYSDFLIPFRESAKQKQEGQATCENLVLDFFRTGFERILSAPLVQLMHAPGLGSVIQNASGLYTRILDSLPRSEIQKLTHTDPAFQLLSLALQLDAKVRVSESGRGLVSVTDIKSPWRLCLSRLDDNPITFALLLIRSVQYYVDQRNLFLESKATADDGARALKTEGLLGEFSKIATETFDRLSTFSTQVMVAVLQDESVRRCTALSFFTTNTKLYDSAVTLVNEAFGTEAKLEGISALVYDNFTITLKSFNWAVATTLRDGTYGHLLRVIRTCRILTDRVCNDYLAGSTRISREEVSALVEYWNMQWKSLAFVFEHVFLFQTDVKRVELENFTRDTIEYADAIFSFKSLIANTIVRSEDGDDMPALAIDQHTKALLRPVKGGFSWLCKWLRLRDEPLLRIAHRLVCTVLRDFLKFNVQLQEEDEKLLLKFTADDSSISKYRNCLTDDQRFELLSAMGSEPPVPPVPPMPPVIEVEDERDSKLDIDFNNDPGLKEPITSSSLPKHSSKFNTLEPVLSGKRMVKKRGKEEVIAPPVLVDKLAAIQAKSKPPTAVTATKHPVSKKKAEESASSSEDEGEISDDALLFASVQAKKLKTKLLDTNLPVNNRLRNIMAARKNAQGKPQVRRRLMDLNTLYRRVLSWDFFHDADVPPGNDGKTYVSIPTKFDDVQQYTDVFEPLLMLEMWWGFREIRQGSSNPYTASLTLISRLNTDGFLELHVSMATDKFRDFDVKDADVILLALSPTPLASEKDPNCLALVRSIAWKKGEVQLTLWAIPKPAVSAAFRVQVQLTACKLQSLTTVEREFGALSMLPAYELCDNIINATPSPISSADESTLQRIQSLYTLNEGQASAIISTVENTGFTLVQGPPGTGKTKTIVGMVGSLLSTSGSSASATQQKSQGNKLQKIPRKKLLLCAPSNAAVDELVVRLRNGVKLMNGENFVPKIVRFGRPDMANADIKDLTLDGLLDARLKLQSNEKGSGPNLEMLLEQHKKVKMQRDALRNELDAARAAGTEPVLEKISSMRSLSDQLRVIGKQLDEAREQQGTERRNAEIRRRQIQQDILDQADIICATLSGSGHETMRSGEFKFDAIIIDEAAQCIELSALIPLRYNCNKCILVGDPKQLPPTVLSREATEYSYNQSLFVRMQKNSPENIHLLSVQYRMHPEISLFPSQEFYDGRLLDGEGLAISRKSAWHDNVFSPYRFFHVEGTESTYRDGAYYNRYELDALLHLYTKLKEKNRNINFTKKIGVITPYRAQLTEIRKMFSQRFGAGILEEIEFNTTDAFQGHENEIIFFSCVRSSPTRGIGFLNDVRRLNVALTRAKCSLFILGNADALSRRDGAWKRLVESSRNRNCFTDFKDVQKGIIPKLPLPEPVPLAPTGSLRGKKREKDNFKSGPSMSTEGPPRKRAIVERNPPNPKVNAPEISQRPPSTSDMLDYAQEAQQPPAPDKPRGNVTTQGIQAPAQNSLRNLTTFAPTDSPIDCHTPQASRTHSPLNGENASLPSSRPGSGASTPVAFQNSLEGGTPMTVAEPLNPPRPKPDLKSRVPPPKKRAAADPFLRPQGKRKKQ